MKTKFKISIAFIFFNIVVFAQSLPSVTSVFNDIKSNPKIYESLKNDYKISNPKACKIEMKMTIGSGEIVSDWSTYKSQQGLKLNYYWPDDRAYTVFTVTTPESTEGVTYSLPLVVEYSRIKNSVLQNDWSFYWWYFDTPYSSTGGKQDHLFYELLIGKLSEIEGDLLTYRRNDIPDAIVNFTSIQKIEKSSEPDIRENYSNADNVTRIYAVYGETSKFADSDDAEIESNMDNCVSYLKVQFRREKENGKEGDWKIDSFLGGFDTGLKESNPTENKNLYKTLGSHGFKTVFQKEKQPKAIPYFSDLYQEKYADEFSQVIMDFYLKKEDSEEKLKSFIVPGGEDIFESFKNYFNELEIKLVKIKPSTNSPQHDGLLSRLYVNANKVDDGYLILYTNLERKSCTSEKGLNKIYKDAGMSKDVINTRGGHYYASESIQFKIVLIDDQIKIASKLESKNEIPF